MQKIKYWAPDPEENDDHAICPALPSTQRKQKPVLISNSLEHPNTLKKKFNIAIFSILTKERAKYIENANKAPLFHRVDFNHNDDIHYVNAVLKMPKFEEFNESYRMPTH